MSNFITAKTEIAIMCGHVTIIGEPKLFGHGLPKCADAKVCEIDGKQYLTLYEPNNDKKFHNFPLDKICADMFSEKWPENMRQIGPYKYNSVFYKYDDFYYIHIQPNVKYYMDTETLKLFNVKGYPVEFEFMDLPEPFDEIEPGDLIMATHVSVNDNYLPCYGIQACDNDLAYYPADKIGKLKAVTTEGYSGSCNYCGSASRIDDDIEFFTINGEGVYYITLRGDDVYLTSNRGDKYLLTTDITKAATFRGYSSISIIVDYYVPSREETTFGRLTVTCQDERIDAGPIYRYTNRTGKEYMFIMEYPESAEVMPLNFKWIAPAGANTKLALRE